MIKAPRAPEEVIQLRKHHNPELVITLREPVKPRFNPNGRTPIFYHTGDIGDIIAGLSVMKLMGGGRLQIGPDIGVAGLYGYPRCRGEMWVVDFLYDFLMAQSYVRSVSYAPTQKSVDVNLNLFRKWTETHRPWDSYRQHKDISKHPSLSDMHQITFGVSLRDDEAWLRCDTEWVYDGKPIIVQRSPRYHNVPDTFPWQRIINRFGDQMLFVGLASEHEEFCRLFGEVQFYYVESMLEMARLIHGSKLYIGNQSSPFWIAEGLKHKLILEAWDLDPNCFFNRPGHYHVMDGDWPLVLSVIEESIA